MGKTKLREIFEERELTAAQAKRMGVNYNTLDAHLRGVRQIGPETALRYERLLGIPRWELRPDLWEPPEKTGQGEP